MSVIWDDDAQAELFEWMKTDRKTALKIYKLILDIQRNGLTKGWESPNPCVTIGATAAALTRKTG